MKLNFLWFLLLYVVDFLPIFKDFVLFKFFLLFGHFLLLMLRKVHQHFSHNLVFPWYFHFLCHKCHSLLFFRHLLWQWRIFLQNDFNILLFLFFNKSPPFSSQIPFCASLLFLRLHVHLFFQSAKFNFFFFPFSFFFLSIFSFLVLLK